MILISDQVNYTTFTSMSSYSTNEDNSVIQSSTAVLIIIFVLGFLFNIVSLIAIINSRMFHSINILIMNLALADLVYISGIPLFVINTFTQSWPFELVGCRIFFLTDMVGMLVGVYTVTALSVERYVEVIDKKKRLESYSNKFKLLIILVYLIILWIVAIMFSLPMVLSTKIEIAPDYTYTCDTKWSEKELNMFFIVKFVISFIIPFTIITFSSTKLLIFLKKWKKSNPAAEPTSQRASVNEKSLLDRSRIKKPANKTRKNQMREKAIKIVLSIVLLFFLQWTPLWLTELYKAMSTNLIDNIQLISSIITLVSYSNSVSNPLLYLFLTVNFRKHLADFLKTCKK